MRQPGQLGRLGTTPPVPRRPTTCLPLLLGIGLAFAFALLTWQVAADGPLRRLDERVGRALADGPLPTGAAELLADLGNMTVAVPVLAVVAAYTAWRTHRVGTALWWPPPLTAVLVMTAVPLLVIPLKLAVDRTGPPGMDGTGYYPSGHTATATVAYGAATLLLLPHLPRPNTRRALTLTCALLNLGVGYGLVRRGYHWPIDVLASWCLGGILLLVMAASTARYGREPTADQHSPRSTAPGSTRAAAPRVSGQPK
ncbi:membrane protein [Streptomyces flavofungini]|nr:membrane protein [Streptomyces flavofungini]